MTIDEHPRHGIHTWMADAMGAELGDGLMSMLPPTGWADVATKHDLVQLELRFDHRFQVIDGHFEVIDGRFEMIDRRFDGVCRRLGSIDVRFDQMEHTVIGALDGRMAQTFRAMFFALAGLLVALTTLIVSVVLAIR